MSLENVKPDREGITEHFGPDSPSYQRDVAALKALYQENAGLETIRIKRRLWYDLLRTALGEVAFPEEMDDLFVRHTYLGAVVGMVVQASFGIDIRRLAETDPADLLQGRELHRATGLQGVLESDFFAWPNEVGGSPLLQTLARRVARFDWAEAPPNTGATLYEAVIPPEERRHLGEYYTPAWLARVMVRELVNDPLKQRVLDPACGSGAFVTEAVARFIEAANERRLGPLGVPRQTAGRGDRHRRSSRGGAPGAGRVDAGRTSAYQQSRSRRGDMPPSPSPSTSATLCNCASAPGTCSPRTEITIQTRDEEDTELVFPTSLVERAEQFDALMGDVSAHIERGDDPYLALDDNHVHDPGEREVISRTIAAMQQLHDRGRDHIWAYYTRNMVRPVALSRAKVDVVIGNPPWINYNQTADILRDELSEPEPEPLRHLGGRPLRHPQRRGRTVLRPQRRPVPGGGRRHRLRAAPQRVAGRALRRLAKRRMEGTTGNSVQRQRAHSGAPETGQKQRAGPRPGRRLRFDKAAWDLEQLEPNTFFPIPASVAFARKLPLDSSGKPLVGPVERWLGTPGADNMLRQACGHRRHGGNGSPYADYSQPGARTIVPRCLFFVNETANTAIVQAAQTVTVNPRRGNQDKAPWKDLDLTAITGQTVERRHLFDVHLGETVAPYVTLEPLHALLPVKQGDAAIPADDKGPGGVRLGGLERRMRERWQTINLLWETNKALVNRLNLLGELDYRHKLSSQLEWQQDAGNRPVRVVYTTAGQPTAALIGPSDLVTERLYWVTCPSENEANYLLAVINSDALRNAVAPLMSKGLFGARDLHKHLWKLPIPGFDPARALHNSIADAGGDGGAGRGGAADGAACAARAGGEGTDRRDRPQGVARMAARLAGGQGSRDRRGQTPGRRVKKSGSRIRQPERFLDSARDDRNPRLPCARGLR